MTQTSAKDPVALVVGRWQLYHKGQQTLIDQALNTAGRVIIAVGSALRSRNDRNPFSWEERRTQIELTLTEEQKRRAAFIPIRDYYDDDRWSRAVREGVARILGHPAAAVTLIGYKKDETSGYLDYFPGWRFRAVQPRYDISSTDLRRIYFEDGLTGPTLGVLKEYVQPQVLEYLSAWGKLPVYAERVAEHLATVQYRKEYTAPYYLTADSILECNDHVALIRRRSRFGNGLWALPGGFLNPGEQFYAGALRELHEETTYHNLAPFMQRVLKWQRVFDHPLRSPRGRLITTAFHFLLPPENRLPHIEGRDDALHAQWIHKDQLSGLTDRMLDDHDCILDSRFNLFQDARQEGG